MTSKSSVPDKLIPELQRRYTELNNKQKEEKEITAQIAKVKAQLTQLQVEALDIKSRIRTSNTSVPASTKASGFPEASETNKEVLNLSSNPLRDLDKMMTGEFEVEMDEDEDER